MERFGVLGAVTESAQSAADHDSRADAEPCGHAFCRV
jgi:hypothetical protein